jgi:cytochrome c2
MITVDRAGKIRCDACHKYKKGFRVYMGPREEIQMRKTATSHYAIMEAMVTEFKICLDCAYTLGHRIDGARIPDKRDV